MNKKQKIFFWWLPLFTLCILAYCIQINIYLYKDITILLHLAAQVLQGETYTQDIFEPNPPMIFYLQIPAIIFAKISGIKIIYCFRVYLLTLIVLCVVCSHILFEKLFKKSTILISLMSLALACILLFQPASQFGQREHFLIILTSPYLLLAACRLEKINIRKPLAFLIGIMAGIGFSIKPFFLTTLLLIELLFIYKQKNILGWLRIESITATMIILCYGVSVIFFFPAYWQIILPIWMPYYRGIIRPWLEVLTNTSFLFCSAILGTSLLTNRKEEPHSTLKLIFSLALFGYLITYLIPRVAWFYHIIPALSIACLYFVLILGELAEIIFDLSNRIRDFLFICLLGAGGLFVPVLNTITSTFESIAEFHSDTTMSKLSTFINQHKPDNSFDFFSMTHTLFNLEFYSTAHFIGRIPYFFWEYIKLSPRYYSQEYQRETQAYVLNIIIHDLNERKPAFLIVDIPSSMNYLNQRIDFPKEFSINPLFKEAWSHYAYSTTIGPYEIYQRKQL